ncbi:MAG: glutamate 2,3-aminomutase [Peptococcaceae bacterium]|nr:glutamate 2,3-aminomutase [Peptococcaceae bacterium]
MAINDIDATILTPDEKRRISQKRARELRDRISDFLEAKEKIPTGFKCRDEINKVKKRLMGLLKATDADWNDWRWQLRNRIRNVDLLAKIVDLDEERKDAIKKVSASFRWAISPYYTCLVVVGGVDGPLWRQAVPAGEELEDTEGDLDPMKEELTSPVPGITRRYPDRLIINVTNQCAMYCRHCQRRRNIGEIDTHQSQEVLEGALDYIRSNPEIRDVLITGGDALMLKDDQIDWLLGELDAIEHVEIKRLGTRTLVTLPQRITPELCAVLAKHPPVYINTQFNHPLEVTEEAARACDMLIKAGVVLGNQAVLLRGVNNDPHVMKKLNHELLKIRVRPYYIFHAKQVKGTKHFITPVDEGLKIMEHLRGYTSGLAVPTYIINAPGGYGKTPVTPEYVKKRKPGKIVLRTWENRVIDYPDKV